MESFIRELFYAENGILFTKIAKIFLMIAFAYFAGRAIGQFAYYVLN